VAEEHWSRLRLSLPTAMADWVGAELIDWGSPGVEVIEASEVAADRTVLVAHFRAEHAFVVHARLRTFLEQLGEQARPWDLTELEPVPPVDWAEQWRYHFPPLPVGRRLLIVPPWEVPPVADGRVPLVLQPGMAFGTGRHPSTELVLEAIERLAPGIPGPVLDVGCGSGILGLAAVLLGAPAALGFDYDTDAVTSARDNVALNDLSDRVLLVQARFPELALTGPFPLVLANVYATFFQLHHQQLSGLVAPGGHLLAAGLQEEERGEGSEVVRLLTTAGLDARLGAIREGWALVEARRP
jgi:ribosomal protein L11 methyltransferase